MIRTYNYPLRPTKTQAVILESWRIACQQLYNAALEERREAYRKQKKSISYFDQQKELTELRAEDLFYEAIPVWALRSVLVRLDRAFKAFFRRVKSGEKPGFLDSSLEIVITHLVLDILS